MLTGRREDGAVANSPFPDGFLEGFPQKILLAADGSEDAAVATRAAVDLAGGDAGHRAELHVVHAFEFVPPREYMDLALRLRSPYASVEEGGRFLEEQAEGVREAGGEVAGTRLVTGSPVDGILRAAEEMEADLVVVGGRGLGGVRSLMMGSVSEGVVHNAPCPVLVVREDAWPPSRLFVADDSSEEAELAGLLAARLGRLLGVGATLLQVYPRVLESVQLGGGEDARLVREALREAEEKLQARAAGLKPVLGSAPSVRLVADEGADGIDGVAMTLLDFAEEAGGTAMFALGGRGLGGARRVGVGSACSKVVRAHPGPVLVCPYPEGAIERERAVPQTGASEPEVSEPERVSVAD